MFNKYILPKILVLLYIIGSVPILPAQQLTKTQNREFNQKVNPKTRKAKTVRHRELSFAEEIREPLPYKRFTVDIPLLLGANIDFTLTGGEGQIFPT